MQLRYLILKSETRKMPNFNIVDNQSPGSRPGTFVYNYDTQAGERSRRYVENDFSVPSPFGFEADESGIHFTKSGVKIQDEILRTGGLVAEVGGPSDEGFEFLAGLDLPSKPIITNVGSAYRPTRPGKFEDLDGMDKITLDIMADSAHLPFADKSVGILLASCLNPDHASYIPGVMAISEARRREKLAEEVLARVALRALHEPSITVSNEESQSSPRMGFWREAQRVVKPKGLVIYVAPRTAELQIAESLGFEVIAHASVMPNAYGEEVPREVVFRRRPLTQLAENSY